MSAARPSLRSSPADHLRLYAAALMMEISCSASPRWPSRQEMRDRITAELARIGYPRAMAYAAHSAGLQHKPHHAPAAAAWRVAVARAILLGPW